MRMTKRQLTRILRASVPVITVLLVLAILPHHHFGWTDVEVMATALLAAGIIFFTASYLWKQLGRNNSNSN